MVDRKKKCRMKSCCLKGTRGPPINPMYVVSAEQRADDNRGVNCKINSNCAFFISKKTKEREESILSGPEPEDGLRQACACPVTIGNVVAGLPPFGGLISQLSSQSFKRKSSFWVWRCCAWGNKNVLEFVSWIFPTALGFLSSNPSVHACSMTTMRKG